MENAIKIAVRILIRFIGTPFFLLLFFSNYMMYTVYMLIHWIYGDSQFDIDLTESLHREDMENLRKWFTEI
jgi:hypothetical protein